MSTRSARFGVGDPGGARSSEWVVFWQSNKSDVYLATRTLGDTLRVSLHERGLCFVRAPDAGKWMSPGVPPRLLDRWVIDPSSRYEFPFGIVFPTSELRQGPWAKRKDKGTIWLPLGTGTAVEVAVFLTRAARPPNDLLAFAGWNKIIVSERLNDGRDLTVAATDVDFPEDRRIEVERIKGQVRSVVGTFPSAQANPRLLVFATDGRGTRRFVEVAVQE